MDTTYQEQVRTEMIALLNSDMGANIRKATDNDRRAIMLAALYATTHGIGANDAALRDVAPIARDVVTTSHSHLTITNEHYPPT